MRQPGTSDEADIHTNSMFAEFPSYSVCYEYKPMDPELTSQICVEGPKRGYPPNMPNHRHATATLNNSQSLLIIGGQAGCIYVKRNSYTARAHSNQPLSSDRVQTWTSDEVKIETNEDSIMVLQLLTTHQGVLCAG